MWVKIPHGNGQEAVGRPACLLLGAAGSLYLKDRFLQGVPWWLGFSASAAVAVAQPLVRGTEILKAMCCVGKSKKKKIFLQV